VKIVSLIPCRVATGLLNCSLVVITKRSKIYIYILVDGSDCIIRRPSGNSHLDVEASECHRSSSFTSTGSDLCCIAWLVTAAKQDGNLSVNSTGPNDPLPAGNVVALLSLLIFVPVLTYAIGYDKYNWESIKAIRKGDDHDNADAADIDLEDVPGEAMQSADAGAEVCRQDFLESNQ
jgi:hypothetical protein